LRVEVAIRVSFPFRASCPFQPVWEQVLRLARAFQPVWEQVSQPEVQVFRLVWLLAEARAFPPF
jgi:hypothetical protein